MTVTAPKPGDVVSGTITATADASDDVGVTAVDFRYFDGEGDGPGPYYALGIDTRPRRTRRSSTRPQFPNTDAHGRTMYAIARDAAGNQTRPGNGITVSNANVTGASISITGDPSALAGAASAPIDDIPVDAIRGAADDGPDSAPLAGIPLGRHPARRHPARPASRSPASRSAASASRRRTSTRTASAASRSPRFRSTRRSDTWQARLNASPTFSGTPEQSVTLAQVLGTSVVTTPTPVTLDDLDLEASPLAGIPLAGIALGGLPLAGIPLAGIAASTPAENLAAWCAFINTQPGYSCTDPELAHRPDDDRHRPTGRAARRRSRSRASRSAGIDLEQLPARRRSRSQGSISTAPRSAASRSDRDRLRQLAARGHPARRHLDGGKGRDPHLLGRRSFTCADTATLGAGPRGRRRQPERQGRGHRVLLHARHARRRSRVVAGHTPILLEDFVLNGLPPDVTLEDLLGSILSEVAYDWEALPLPGFPIQDFSDDGGINDYEVDFTLTGDEGGSAPASIAVKIPDGARYVLGSS